jgi:hypothetical protein
MRKIHIKKSVQSERVKKEEIRQLTSTNPNQNAKVVILKLIVYYWK